MLASGHIEAASQHTNLLRTANHAPQGDFRTGAQARCHPAASRKRGAQPRAAERAAQVRAIALPFWLRGDDARHPDEPAAIGVAQAGLLLRVCSSCAEDHHQSDEKRHTGSHSVVLIIARPDAFLERSQRLPHGVGRLGKAQPPGATKPAGADSVKALCWRPGAPEHAVPTTRTAVEKIRRKGREVLRIKTDDLGTTFRRSEGSMSTRPGRSKCLESH